MMFASKTPRDLNHDPEPWCPLTRQERYPRQYDDNLHHDPRPEFDHVQHNEPNPILVMHRKHRDEVAAAGLDPIAVHLEEIAFAAEIYGEIDFEDGSRADDRHIDHARKVLTRLVRLDTEPLSH